MEWVGDFHQLFIFWLYEKANAYLFVGKVLCSFSWIESQNQNMYLSLNDADKLVHRPFRQLAREQSRVNPRS